MALQIRRGTQAEWEANNSNVVAGEPAITLDTGRLFVGTDNGEFAEFANVDSLAPAYDSSTSYSVGDVCNYQGELYVCTGTTTGAWDSTKWESTYVGTSTLDDGSVTTDKIADGAVTNAKLAQSGGVLDEVASLRTDVEIMNGGQIELTEFDDTMAIQTAAVEYIGGKLKLYGTTTSARYFLCLNGQNIVKTSTQAFEQTLPAGTYIVHIKATGNVPSGYTPKVAYTTTKFNSASYVADGEVINVNAPIMCGYLCAVNNYGTNQNPTYIELSLTPVPLTYEEKAGKEFTYTSLDNIREKNTEIQLLLTASHFENGGLNTTGGNVDRPKKIRTAGYISCAKYDKIIVSANTGYMVAICFYSDNRGTMIERVHNVEGNVEIPFPPNTKFIRLQYESTNSSTTLSVNDYSNVTISFDYAVNTKWTSIGSKTKWLSIGDSITNGKCSDNSGGFPAYGWSNLIANTFGYDMYDSGINGMGYVAYGSNNITLNDQLTTIEALTDDFNLITIMLGINDYNTEGVTISAVTTSLASAIERLMARFPTARLVVFTPLNACNRGTQNVLYDYGYTFDGRTLKDVSDAIVSTCESYGVECHNLTSGFVLNKQNITTLLPDGVHPSQLAHILIGKAIARYLID